MLSPIRIYWHTLRKMWYKIRGSKTRPQIKGTLQVKLMLGVMPGAGPEGVEHDKTPKIESLSCPASSRLALGRTHFIRFSGNVSLKSMTYLGLILIIINCIHFFPIYTHFMILTSVQQSHTALI